MGWTFIDVNTLRGMLKVMRECAGTMTGPQVIEWVIKTVDELEEEIDARDETTDGERA